MTNEASTPSGPDEALVDRARRGEPAAFDQLVAKHHEVAFRVAVGVLKDDDAAADAVQDAFVKAFGGLDGFRGDSRFRSWLLTIVLNEARGALRRTSRRRETALDSVGPVVDTAEVVDRGVVIRDEAARARQLVDTLPEKQRLAVTLRIDEGLSFREIGELIGSSEGAARVNYHHGIRRLREKMTDDDM